MTDKPIQIAGWTARDIATQYTFGASRVQMHRVDESTVLAVGFDPAEPHRATGRVVWIMRDGAEWWQERRCNGPDGTTDDPLRHDPPSMWMLTTTDDLDALVRWLRGEA